MAIDWDTLNLAPNYAAFGVEAVFATLFDKRVTVTAIDKTDGVSITDGGVEVMTVRPACYVRASELADNGVGADDLDGSRLLLNGKYWRVNAVKRRGTPRGENAGEVVCFLTDSGENDDE